MGLVLVHPGNRLAKPLAGRVLLAQLPVSQRQEEEIARQRRNEETHLPPDLDYARVAGLSNEVRQKLEQIRPTTVGQAARVAGVTPAAVSILLVHLKKSNRAA